MKAKELRCGHFIGAEQRHCHSTRNLREYLPGYRCPAHTPAAVAGRPEPPEGEGPLPGAWTTPTPDAASWAAIDARHIRSGKRRSNTTDYRAAKAAERRTA
ncbi:hypothetical protein [Kitasatospora camelliae]|uniref:Uncharacterized protein n=1 Tax=Kitasatospora camelliae TaxID=3156397 RepID=A0AAU8K4J2_9ACTN